MNTKIAVSVIAVLAAILTIPQSAFAAEVPVTITVGSQTKTIDAYSPNPVEVSVGDTVTWTNADSTTHTATSGTSPTADGKFGSVEVAGSILLKDKSMSYTFEEAGEFPYFCALHPNMVGTVKVAGGGTFTVPASIDDKEFEITGKSDTVRATAATIESGKAVHVTFDKAGEVELTLLKTMISGSITVQAGGEAVNAVVTETETATTIKFTVPEGVTTVDIMGTTVIPEFPVIAALILAASIAAILGYTRFGRGSAASFFGRV